VVTGDQGLRRDSASNQKLQDARLLGGGVDGKEGSCTMLLVLYANIPLDDQACIGVR